MIKRFKEGQTVEYIGGHGKNACDIGATGKVFGYDSDGYVNIMWNRNGLDKGQMDGGYIEACFKLCKEKKFQTKDSGKRVNFESGFNRDVNDGKPRYDLIPTELLTRLAGLYTRGAEKYGVGNWKKANSEEEYARFKESAFRHFIQWMNGDTDEDHMSAVVWNLFSYTWHKEYKNDK